jgi:hypothetical protein
MICRKDLGVERCGKGWNVGGVIHEFLVALVDEVEEGSWEEGEALDIFE